MVNRILIGAMVLVLLLLTLNLVGQQEGADLNELTTMQQEKVNYSGKYEGRIALTFDDGPHPEYTVQILDYLKENDVKATFFVLGEQGELYPDIVQREAKEGHEVGNHTYSHLQLTHGNQDVFLAELAKTNALLEEITHQEIAYVRPPYGSWEESLRAEIDMIPVLWTIDSKDWCSTDSDAVVRRVVKNASDGDIILMHDYYDVTVSAVKEIVSTLLQEGYDFVTVNDIMQ